MTPSLDEQLKLTLKDASANNLAKLVASAYSLADQLEINVEELFYAAPSRGYLPAVAPESGEDIAALIVTVYLIAFQANIDLDAKIGFASS